jgi:deoxyribodipyrimidine photo-lyase
MNPNLSYQEILSIIDDFDPIKYAKTRNHLSGAVSKLSPYITRGVISLPAIRAQVLKKHSAHNAQKFIQELAWREYFQKVFTAKGEEIFSDLRFSRDDWQHHEVVTAIKSASTGVTVIDEKLKELEETGYMHNHARMWTAMLACNVGKAHWYEMSRFLYYHLIDGDLASNTLSWQWVAGTSVQKQYVANQDLINNCSDIKQRDTYLDMPIETVGKQDIPLALLTHEAFSYKTEYPTSDDVADVSDKTVFLYHPWSIDPLWRKDEGGERIFIIEPKLFDRFPVSPLVLDHMLTLVKTHVPNAKVFVGNAETIPGIDTATVFSKAHPTTTHFPGHKDEGEELFLHVRGYHQSFFKFWEACERG